MGSHCCQGHLDHLKTLKVTPIGYFDPNTTIPAKYGAIHRYETLEDAKTDANAVMIMSPDRFHLTQMEQALQMGWHIFCEKPLISAENENGTARLQSLLREVRQKDITITTCHPRRFDKPYATVKQGLPELTNRFGPVLHVELDFSYHKPSKTGLHGGSLLQDHANHEVDYFCWLMGIDIGFTATKLWDEEDRYALSGVRRDGVTFFFQGTRRLNARVYPETIKLRFERGELFVDTKCAENSYVFNHETRKRSAYTAGQTDYEERFTNLNQHWLDVMAGRAENYVSLKQMLLNTTMSTTFDKQETFTFIPTS